MGKRGFDPRGRREAVRTDYPPMIDTTMRARKKGDSKEEKNSLWEIVSIKEAGIALSGPGPCRSYQVVDHDTFEKEWDVIWCRSPSGHENQECHMVYAGQGPLVNGRYSITCAFCGRDEEWHVVGETFFQRMTRPVK